MGCGTSCLKVLLILFDILFWIFGLGLLGIGVWLKVDRHVANLGLAMRIGTEQHVVDIAAWVFIGAGILAFVVGFAGCCGAVMESQCLLGFYMVCIIFIFAAEIVIAIFTGLYYSKIQDDVASSGVNWLKSSYDGDSLISKGFNYVQLKFCCCGVKDFRDYKGNKYLKNNNPLIGNETHLAYGCCKPDNDDISGDYTDISKKAKDECLDSAVDHLRTGKAIPAINCEDSFRAKGCEGAIVDWAKERLPIFFGAAAGVAFVQIIIFSLTVCLCMKLRRGAKA